MMLLERKNEYGKGSSMKKRLAVALCLMLFGGAVIGNSVDVQAASVVNGLSLIHI